MIVLKETCVHSNVEIRATSRVVIYDKQRYEFIELLKSKYLLGYVCINYRSML